MNLSASTLGVFQECPKCFWLSKVKKIERPRGIFPSLPSGIDRILKDWANGLREKGGVVPTLVTDKGPHKLFADAEKLKKWQNWRSGLKWDGGNGHGMIGALDDVLINEKGQFVPLDYKTKGSPTTQEDVEKYYLRQLDCYALLLGTAGPVADYGFIMSHFPAAREGVCSVLFSIETFCLKTDPKRAEKLFHEAVACVSSTIEPEAGATCEYCKFARERAYRED